jgi:hypothetical protein
MRDNNGTQYRVLLCWVPLFWGSRMLSVANKPFNLCVVMLNVVATNLASLQRRWRRKKSFIKLTSGEPGRISSRHCQGKGMCLHERFRQQLWKRQQPIFVVAGIIRWSFVTVSCMNHASSYSKTSKTIYIKTSFNAIFYCWKLL